MDKQAKETKYTYLTTIACPLCENELLVKRFRQVRMRVLRRDPDHHVWYANDLHPVRYFVTVCCWCGYAAGNNRFSDLPAAEKARLKGRTGGLQVTEAVNVERDDPELVAQCFGHAIRLGLIAKVPASVLGSLYLRTAWFCREEGDQAQELDFLRLAYQSYERAYQEEDLPIGPMTRLGLIYLLGELARQIREFEKSSRWFNMAVRLKEDLIAEPALAKLVHEQYQQMRDDYKKYQEENH
ncbi:MAG TPA: DUF2225 domain-containing protein [Bacillota bacterium]|jgi:uncharacterized protein (DUF2225 family)|nr:DUF2225 domain-containing protein [Bacillota bacterium]HPT68123.1 DUF2225 domain-containing protein [Bacillota bacterium]